MYEIFAGEAGNVSPSAFRVHKQAHQPFKTMRFIVSLGWCIYPFPFQPQTGDDHNMAAAKA